MFQGFPLFCWIYIYSSYPYHTKYYLYRQPVHDWQNIRIFPAFLLHYVVIIVVSSFFLTPFFLCFIYNMSENVWHSKRTAKQQNLPLLTKCYSMALSIICYHKLPLTFLYLFLLFIYVRISKILISSIQQKRTSFWNQCLRLTDALPSLVWNSYTVHSLQSHHQEIAHPYHRFYDTK